MTQKVKVIKVNALSYSGTTWINLMLGSHPSVFTLGPPEDVWKSAPAFDEVCLIHGESCSFWRGFANQWGEGDNLLLSLAEYAGVSHILFDSPSPEFLKSEMDHPDIEIIELWYTRDARAITASYSRKNPQLDYVDTIAPDGWFYHSFMNFESPSSETSEHFVKYEDVVAEPLESLQRIGRLLGLEYDESHLRFWEHDHHITCGNAGPIAMIKTHTGIPVDTSSIELKTYVENYENAREQGAGVYLDERWKDLLDERELARFDRLLGQKNATLGYPRDFSNFWERVAYQLRSWRGFILGSPGKKAHSPSEPTANDQPPRYLDEVAPTLSTPRPYAVESSRLRKEQILANVSRNFFEAYGPFAQKGKLEVVGVEPLFRYRELLSVLKERKGIRFLTAESMANLGEHEQSDQVLVHIRHDVDGDIVAAVRMSEIERSLDVQTTYYLLHTAPYYGLFDKGGRFQRNAEMIGLYKQIQEDGNEVGLHTDALTLYYDFEIDGATAICEELGWLRESGITIVGTASHNSFETYQASNFSIFKGRPLALDNFRNAKAVEWQDKWAPLQVLDEAELGLQYEANDLFWNAVKPIRYACILAQNLWCYYEVCGSRDGKGCKIGKAHWYTQEELLELIYSADNGDRFILSVHPMYFGMRMNVEDDLTQQGSTRAHREQKNGVVVSASPDDNQFVQQINSYGEIADEDVHYSAHPQKLLLLGKRNVAGREVCRLSQFGSLVANLSYRNNSSNTWGVTKVTAHDEWDQDSIERLKGYLNDSVRCPDVIVIVIDNEDVKQHEKNSEKVVQLLGILKTFRCASPDRKLIVIDSSSKEANGVLSNFEMADQIVDVHSLFESNRQSSIAKIQPEREGIWTHLGHALIAREIMRVLD